MADAVDVQTTPWRARDILWALLVGVAIAIGLSVPVYIFFELFDASLDDPIPIAAATTGMYIGLAAGIYLMIIRRRGVALGDIGFRRVRLTTIALMMPAYIAMLMVSGLATLLLDPLIGDPPSVNEQLLLEEGVSISGIEAIAMFVTVAIIGPFMEEVIFRGLVYGYLRRRWGVLVGILVSSALFALVHIYVPLLPTIFVMGVFMAGVVERYKSLYPAIALHSLANGVAVVLFAAGVQVT